MLLELQKELTKLSEEVEADWEKSQYDINVFPHLCKNALTSFQLKTSIFNLDSMMKELASIILPAQTFPRGEFSDFPITLVRTEKLLIDIYVWYKSDTAIHNHHFCGAFKVISGNSYQIQYSFEKEKELFPGLEQGIMKEIGNHHLAVGDVFAIEPRDEFIHHVFHLGQPTITLCLRTPFFNGENLSTFIYPKYKVEFAPISMAQSKWLQLMTLKLSKASDSKPEVIWEDGEILRMLFLSYNKHIHMNPEVVNYLLNYLESRGFVSDFFELLNNQNKLNEKLKKFGFLTQPKVESV